jgi:hypothetical protein
MHRPDVIVLAGRQLDDDTIARWANLLRRSIGPLPLAIYRPPMNPGWGTLLPPAPAEAQLRLVEVADDPMPVGISQLARAG